MGKRHAAGAFARYDVPAFEGVLLRVIGSGHVPQLNGSTALRAAKLWCNTMHLLSPLRQVHLTQRKRWREVSERRFIPPLVRLLG